MPLPKVRTDLRFNHLDNQVLVYDPGADEVHLLDPSTTLVLDLLREGNHTVADIEDALGGRANAASGDSLLTLALDELTKADLLEETGGTPAPLSYVSRRELLRKVTVVGATLIVPAIVTLCQEQLLRRAALRKLFVAVLTVGCPVVPHMFAVKAMTRIAPPTGSAAELLT